MSRFCPGCNADVEVSQGLCLLGHSVEHAAPTGSITDLRAEVDQAFAEASSAVSQVLTAADIAKSAGLEPIEVPSPVVPAAPPPPPPSGSPGGRRAHDVYATISARSPEMAPGSGSLRKDDPIEAFAPPPRMDWGPERYSLRRRRRAEAF